MATMQRTASDGTVFGVFEGANGHYIAVESKDGFHRQPATDAFWGDAEMRDNLRDAVRRYEDSLPRPALRPPTAEQLAQQDAHNETMRNVERMLNERSAAANKTGR